MVFDPKAYLAEDGGGEFDPADYLKDFDPAAYLDAPEAGAPAGLFNDYRPQAPTLAEFSPAQMRAVREGKKDQPGLEGENTVVNRFQQERPPVLREPGPDARPVVGLEGLPVEPQMRARTLRDDGAVIRPLESGDMSVARRVGRTVAGTSGEMLAGAGGAAQLAADPLEKAGKGYKALAEQLGGEQGALDLIGRFYEGSGGVLTGVGRVAAGEGRALAEKMAYEDPQFLDKSVSALTSTAAFMLPGFGVMKGVQALTTVPRLAAALGVASSALMESSIEAGMAREDAIQRGLSEEQADQAGYKVFTANLPITAFGNKLGAFAKAGGMVGKFARSMVAEAGQEAAQQAPQNLVAGKRLETGMGEAALYGAIAGGPFGVLETLSEGRAVEIPAPQFASRSDITPEIAQTAAQMAQVDPVAALKHVTAPADWGKVNELAGQIAADAAAAPGISPAAQQAEVQAKLGQVLTGLTGQQTGPEVAAPTAAPAAPAQAAQAAQGRHTGAEAFVPVEVQVIKNLIDRGSITEAEISDLVSDKAKDGQTLGMIVERGLAAGKTPEAMADEFAGFLEGVKKTAAAQGVPVEPGPGPLTGQEIGPQAVLPAEQAQQMVEVPAEAFVDAVTEAAPEAERPATGEIVAAHMAMQEAAGMDAVEPEATEFIEPEGEVDVSFDPAEFAAEQPAGESPAPAGAPSMRHPAAMTPEQFRERFPNAPEGAHRELVRTAIRAGMDIPEASRTAYADVMTEMQQEWEDADKKRSGEILNKPAALVRVIRKRGYINKASYEKYWKGELSDEMVRKLVRKDGVLMISDIAEMMSQDGDADRLLSDYNEQEVLDLIQQYEREKAFGPQVFHQAEKEGASSEISGAEVLNKVKASVPHSIRRYIKEQQFRLESVQIDDVLAKDLDAADFVAKTENPRKMRPDTAPEPLIIGRWQGRDNSVMDGWHRLASAKAGGLKTIPAYVAVKPEETVAVKKDGLAFVREDIKTQLESVGQSAAEAAANADVVAAFVDAEAKRRGMTPEQFYSEKRRIMVERGVVSGGGVLSQEQVKPLAGTKVVDEKGAPIKMYHGTDQIFKSFELTEGKRYSTFGEESVKSNAIFFSPDRNFSKTFGKKIKPVYLNIQKPLDLTEGIWGQSDPKVDVIVKEVLGETAGMTPIEELWQILDNKDAVNKFRALGYDGVLLRERDKKGEMHDSYAVFSPDQIINAIGVKDPTTLMQGPRASIEVLTHKITLGKFADKSSFLHEAAHDFLQDMADYVAGGQASPEYMKFWEPVAKRYKLEDGKIGRAQHEQFAREFEAYFREGKAPVPALEQVFRTFREWLLAVYRSVKELKVQLNDDIRGFFDEMLTAQKAEIMALTDEAKAPAPDAGMTLEQGPAPERRRLQAVEAAPFSALVRRRKITPGKELTLRVTLVDTGLKAGRISRGQTVKVVDMDYQGGQFLVEKGGEYTLAGPDMFRETYEKPLPEPKPLSPKAQIELSTGLKTPQQKVMLTEMDMLKEKLKNQAQGASVAARHVAREVKQKLMLDIQVRNIDIAEIRGVITEYLAKNIPQESRGKFIAMVRDAKTPLDAAKALNRIDAEAAKLYRRGLLADIRKVIDRSMDAAGVEQTYKDRIRELLAGFELQGHRESTIARLKATREWLAERRAEGKSAELPGYVMDELKILSRKPVDEIPDEALEDVLRTLRIYTELGRAKQASKENVWQIRKEEWLAKLIAGKGQGLDNISLEALKRRGAYDFAVEAMSGVMPEDVVFDLLDGNAAYQGPHAEMKKVLDGRYGAYLAAFDEHYLPVLKLAKKNKLTETDMETIGIYAAAKQEGGAERVLEGRPDLTLEKVQALKLTPPQNEVYQAMRAAMDGTYSQVKEVNRWLYNRDIGQVEDYFSFQTDYDLLNELDLDRRMAMTPDEWAKYSKSVKKGFTKSRVKKGQGPIKINALDIFREHMREVAYFTNMQEHIKMFFEVANTPEYRERYGAKTTKHVLNWLNLLARAGKPASTDVMPWLDMVRVNLGRAMLGFKVTSFAIQVGSTLDAAALMGGRNVVSAMNSILSDKALRRWLLDNFPELKARVGDDIAFVELSGRSKLGKLGEAGMWPLKAIDEFSASVAVTAACFKKLAGQQLDITKPADPEMVHYATLMMRRTQSSSFAKDLGIAFSVGGGRGGYLTTNASANKALLQFRSFMLNRFSMLAHDIPKMEEPGDRAWAYAYIAAAVAAETGIRWGSRALFLALFGAAGLGIGKDLEDKDAQDFAEDYFKNLFDTIPFLSDVARVLTWGNSPVPVLDAANKVFVGAHDALTARNEYQKVKGLRDAIQGIAGLAGIAGTSQAFQLINMAVNRKTLVFPFAEEFAELDDLPIKDRTGDEKARYQVLLGAKTRWSNLNAQYRAAMEQGNIEKAKAVVERASREVNAVKRSGSSTEYQGKRKELGLTW